MYLTIAQAASDVITQPLVSAGAVGAVLWWFMIRNESILKEHTKALNQLSRSINNLVIGSHNHTKMAKEDSKRINDDLSEEKEGDER